VQVGVLRETVREPRGCQRRLPLAAAASFRPARGSSGDSGDGQERIPGALGGDDGDYEVSLLRGAVRVDSEAGVAIAVVAALEDWASRTGWYGRHGTEET